MKLILLQKDRYKDFKRMDKALYDYHKEELKMKELGKYKSFTDGELESLPKSITIKVAVLDGKTVGYIKYRQNNEKDFSLSEMWVDPEYRGRGVASFMLTKFTSVLEDKKEKVRVVLRVHKNNPALKLYSKLGFKEITKGTQGDSLMMQKYLGGK